MDSLTSGHSMEIVKEWLDVVWEQSNCLSWNISLRDKHLIWHTFRELSRVLSGDRDWWMPSLHSPSVLLQPVDAIFKTKTKLYAFSFFPLLAFFLLWQALSLHSPSASASLPLCLPKACQCLPERSSYTHLDPKWYPVDCFQIALHWWLVGLMFSIHRTLYTCILKSFCLRVWLPISLKLCVKWTLPLWGRTWHPQQLEAMKNKMSCLNNHKGFKKQDLEQGWMIRFMSYMRPLLQY